MEVGGAGRVAGVDAVAEAEAAQAGQGGVQPGALLGERLDPGREHGQGGRAGPAVRPGPLPGRRLQAVAGRPEGVGHPGREQPAPPVLAGHVG